MGDLGDMISEGQICAECDIWLDPPQGFMALCPKCYDKDPKRNDRPGFIRADEDSLPVDHGDPKPVDDAIQARIDQIQERIKTL